MKKWWKKEKQCGQGQPNSGGGRQSAQCFPAEEGCADTGKAIHHLHKLDGEKQSLRAAICPKDPHEQRANNVEKGRVVVLKIEGIRKGTMLVQILHVAPMPILGGDPVGQILFIMGAQHDIGIVDSDKSQRDHGNK